MMSFKEATSIAGSLGYPSKMPGTSYGIPATACVTGAKLAQVPGSVCASCYALRGNYIFRDVKKAQATRLASLNDPRWVDAMVVLLARAHAPKRDGSRLPPYHRWHDSGDIQSCEHLGKICEVARATPWLAHWLPTKEGAMVREYIRAGGTVPKNLIIRLSGSMVDRVPPKGLPHTSTVHASTAGEGHRCPAPLQGNKCGDCRACWSADMANVSYHLH